MNCRTPFQDKVNNLRLGLKNTNIRNFQIYEMININCEGFLDLGNCGENWFYFTIPYHIPHVYKRTLCRSYSPPKDQNHTLFNYTFIRLVLSLERRECKIRRMAWQKTNTEFTEIQV